MNREQIQNLLAMIQSTYPNFNPQSKTAAVNAWWMALEEYEESYVCMAFKIYMKTNISGFPPSPGQIIDKINEIIYPKELNEMEAWALVQTAISNSTYNSVEEFEKLPPLVQKAVGLPDNLRQWAITENLNISIVMLNFQKAYRIELQRQNDFQKIPDNIKKIISDINKDSYANQIEHKRTDIIRKNTNIKRIGKHAGYFEKVNMPERCREKLDRIMNISKE